MRELMDKYGVINASYPEMKTSLQESQSVSVALGGMREIWTTRPNEMHLHISRKRGIFRLALETGVPLIPVLVYGENELFEHIPFEFNQWLFDNTGWFLPIPTLHSIGRWWDLLQGRGQPVVAHSGDPIEVSQCSHPTEKDIHSLRTTYIEAVKALYEKTRPSHYAASLTIF
jgi:2-acylglycerol O-acyltransferase 2